MNIDSGRVRQKINTRTKIINAARRLMKTSKDLSLEDVAKEADISRATIYRYFPSLEMLYSESEIRLHYKSSEKLVDESKGLIPSERIRHIQRYYNEFGIKNENAYRRHLSVVMLEALKNKGKLRGARRVEVLKQALEPLREQMGQESWTNLINSSALLMGFDALVICKDVCGLDNQASQRLLEWTLDRILLSFPELSRPSSLH